MDDALRCIAYGSEEYRRLLALRAAVLRAPLGLQFTPEQLVNDAEDTHFALWENGELLGGVILQALSPAQAKLRQMVIAPGHQHRGHGGRLLAYAHEEARAQGFQQTILHARDSAVRFYEAHGYRRVGDGFMEVTLPHWRMERRL